MYLLYITLLCLSIRSHVCLEKPMFKSTKWLKGLNTSQLNYGVAVSDVDHDGTFEWIVAGYNGKNFVLSYDNNRKRLVDLAQKGTKFESLMDVRGQAIGVAACDIDGDGKEEIYFLNTNNAYAGRASYGDKLFKYRNAAYVDLFSDQVNRNLDAKHFAGRSVACIDRFGNGIYSFIVATYSTGGTGKFALIEMDAQNNRNDVSSGFIALKNAASEAGIDKATGGRGIAVGPILGNGYSDIFFDNEGNPWRGNPGGNFLFENNGSGQFTDRANETGTIDENENGRGIALADFNNDGLIDITYGNWDGNHRLFLQRKNKKGEIKFRNVATKAFRNPTLVRTVIAKDFDNDGNLEVFFNNICGRNNKQQPNKLFTVIPINEKKVSIKKVRIGKAREPTGCGTGGAVADMNGDGKLDLILSHGESNGQPLTVFQVGPGSENNWIRILPVTRYGAPARGTRVTATLSDGRKLTRVIDGGSGYLCQMEPVAHIGLGNNSVISVEIQWPDRTLVTKTLTNLDMNKTHKIAVTGK
ncbi:cartilage acidic protein 1-like [Mytilus trossulus]|uniref:cartilage acidic protein 1-like n=1 Tax=Mytilus trossulus TaxID=6551 RepID=UPI0030051EDA